MAAMEERIIVSGGDGVRVFMPPEREPLQQIRLEGAGALCARKECVFCASDWGNTVWRLDAQTLVPTGLFAGGPDMRRLLLSADGARLLILCAEADSVLLLDAASGAPLVLTRAGVNPQNMALDESGEVLAVAAGESGEVLLLSARSLVTVPRVGARQMLALTGMPGRMARENGCIVCATEGFLHAVSMDGTRLIGTRQVPGRASSWMTHGPTLLVCDALSERIFARNGGGQWSLFCACARDMQPFFGGR